MDYTIKHTIGYFDHTYSLHVLGKEVGLIQRPFRINYTSIAPKNKCEVSYLLIYPQYQKKGYGSILLKHLMNELKKCGCDKVQLNSTPESEKFYEKHGFELCGGFINRFMNDLENHTQYYKRL